MHHVLLDLSPLDLCQLWGDLVEAYHGVHRFGGTVAELYAYRFGDVNADLAAEGLMQLCHLFGRAYNCQVVIEGLTPFQWWQHAAGTFRHRACVQVLSGDHAVLAALPQLSEASP